MARKMKDSGIEWIGEIPEGWELRKGKSLYRVTTGKLDANAENPDGDYPFFTCSMAPKRINSYSFDCEALLVAGNGLVGFTQYYKGKFDAYQRTYVFSDFRNVLPSFLRYYVSVGLPMEVQPKSIGSVIQFIKLGDLLNFNITLPSIEQQTIISNYLEFKIIQIDAILSKTRSSIEEYKKLKQAVITQAVTKGVRGEREMKDSGIDYIGQIPAKWVLGKLRNVGDTQNGISKSSEFFGKGFPFVSYSDVYKNYSLPFAVSGLVESTPEEQERYSVKEGDIFFTRTSETIEEVGFSCVCEKDIPNATFAGFLIRVRPFSDKLHTPYAKYYFRSTHLRFYLVKEMNLVTRASLGQSLLKSMPVLLPPLEEQKEIADYLDAKCAEIDRLIAKKEQLVKELESYKKSLIYEVVTGKREV